MHLLDANVLIYAFRRDSPYHGPCYAWLTSALLQDRGFARFLGLRILDPVAGEGG